ncbi:hypothetical protein [Rubellimicrobium arenae]|uniref:hypothetical protein n=1 Tax=Rubellimicrobium arenae TaxID=2817372 RepID=UPI001B30AD45|nr:hypothetical protein [Rubellimicrobium arenae]
MAYRLHVEKKHRATKGGTRPRRIRKGQTGGRILRVEKCGTREVSHHATRGIRSVRV